MRRAFAAVLLGSLAALAPQLGLSAQPPKDKDKSKEPDGALLKAVTPPGGQLRVRVPVYEGQSKAIQMNVRVPNPRAKKGGAAAKLPAEGGSSLDSPTGEYTRATAGLNTLNRNFVTGKMLESWGYAMPKGDTFVLPEFFIEAEQLSPKPMGKSSTVLIRVPNLKFEVQDAAPDGGSQIFRADMIIFLPDLVQVSGSRPPEPRFHFPERFFDLSVPPLAVKRPEKPFELDPPVPDPLDPQEPRPDPLAAVACPLALTPALCFTGASIDGIQKFQTPDGKSHVVTPLLSSCTTGGDSSGIIMNIGMARALKLDVDLTKDAAVGMTTGKRLRLIDHTVKELRLGTLTGPGLKTPRDLVFTNVKIWIEVTESEPMLWIGYPFIVKHFDGAVLAYTADGKAALHGRVDPALIKDPLGAKKK